MLARVLAMGLCPSVCLRPSIRPSQVGVLSKQLQESGWFLTRMFLSNSPTLRCKEIRVSLKIMILPSRTLPQHSGFRKFRHDRSIVETCYQLSSTKVDAQSVINWTVVGQLSWQYNTKIIQYKICKASCCRGFRGAIPPSSDSRPLVYHSDRQALSTVRFRRAGQLATASTCWRGVAWREAQCMCFAECCCSICWLLSSLYQKSSVWRPAERVVFSAAWRYASAILAVTDASLLQVGVLPKRMQG